MTGYGRGEVRGGRQAITVEIKTVNHRYTETVVRVPKELSPLEERVRAMLSGRLSRGRIEVFVNRERLLPGSRTVRVDRDLAGSYHKALRDLAMELGAGDGVTVAELLHLPDVVTVTEEPENLEEIGTALEEATRQALAAVNVMRESEGLRLAADLTVRVEVIRGQLSFVQERVPLVVEAYRARLTQRVADMLGSVNVDENRLAAEVVIFAERSDVEEELVRMASHLDRFGEFLRSDGPVGRKMDFLLQEMNRETNTLGSKIGDVAIAQAVVEVKSEIEKIREQVQNIE
jgi:uncharacterized protein (TIGR00255 family)